MGPVISRQLARLTGGDITVRSELDNGSQFCLTFKAGVSVETNQAEASLGKMPGIAPAKALPRTIPDTPADLAGTRVLLVDDNAVNRRVITLFLAPYVATVKKQSTASRPWKRCGTPRLAALHKCEDRGEAQTRLFRGFQANRAS